jgi:hypothetical protein
MTEEYYTLSIPDLTGKQLYVLETAFGSSAMIVRGRDSVVVLSSLEKVKTVSEMFEWISGYEVYTDYIRVGY